MVEIFYFIKVSGKTFEEDTWVISKCNLKTEIYLSFSFESNLVGISVFSFLLLFLDGKV